MYVKIPISKITKMAIVKTDCKKNLKQVVAEQKCNYAINGGLYDMKTGKVNPIPLRIDGKTIAIGVYQRLGRDTSPLAIKIGTAYAVGQLSEAEYAELILAVTPAVANE